MIHTPTANRLLSFLAGKEETLNGTGKCYIGFSSTAPAADGSNFTEPDTTEYPSYKRIQVCVAEALEYTDKWGTASNGTLSNNEEFVSAECLEEGGWPEFTHFGIFSTKTGGAPMLSDLLRDPDGTPDETTGLYPAKTLTVACNKVAVFRIGTLQLTLQ